MSGTPHLHPASRLGRAGQKEGKLRPQSGRGTRAQRGKPPQPCLESREYLKKGVFEVTSVISKKHVSAAVLAAFPKRRGLKDPGPLRRSLHEPANEEDCF